MHKPFVGLTDKNLVCSFSLRSFQNMSLFYGDTLNALDNRKNFLSYLGINYQDLVCAKQIHSDKIKYVKEVDKGKGALDYESSLSGIDAFITDKRNVPLAIFTADCLSVFLYNPKVPAIGLVHAGWRSSKEKITQKTIESMKENFNSLPQDICVSFGPAIRDCCYEVGEPFLGYFPHAVLKKNNTYYLDLIEINKRQALECGIKEENIFDSDICTSCHKEDFFSFRREGKNCGRLMSVIMLK